MRLLGYILFSCGFFLGGYALTMGTSVQVNYPNGNSFGLPIE